jgi:poly(A) polymerase
MAKQKTVIRKRSQHNISRRDIDADALNVMRRLNRHGHRAYLVGGGVRDILLGRKPKDFDVSTDAKPNQVKKIFRNCFLVGRRFRLAHIRFGYNKIIETSTFRKQPEPNADADNPDASLIQKDDNAFGTPKEDAFRRDFTINGLFYDLKDFSIIDHVGGLPDLKKGIIRCIGDPNVRFREDPVRMLRAVRFASRLGFRIEKNTHKAILTHYKEIEQPPAARLLEETYKLFAFRSAEPAFFLLWKTGLMSVMFPEIDGYLKTQGGEDAPLWRFLAALDSGEHWQGEPTQVLMLATLLCDPVQKRIDAIGGINSFGSYAQIVAELIEPIAQRCRMPKRIKYNMIDIIAEQYQLDRILDQQQTKGKRRKGKSPEQIAERERFPQAKALLEIRAVSGCADPEVTAFWSKIAENVKPQQPERGSDRPTARPKRGRRRPYNRRSRKQSE